jgi:hypothetical protein
VGSDHNTHAISSSLLNLDALLILRMTDPTVFTASCTLVTAIDGSPGEFIESKTDKRSASTAYPCSGIIGAIHQSILKEERRPMGK